MKLRDDAWPNPRLKTDVESARLKGSLIRHGLAASRSAFKDGHPTVELVR